MIWSVKFSKSSWRWRTIILDGWTSAFIFYEFEPTEHAFFVILLSWNIGYTVTFYKQFYNSSFM